MTLHDCNAMVVGSQIVECILKVCCHDFLCKFGREGVIILLTNYEIDTYNQHNYHNVQNFKTSHQLPIHIELIVMRNTHVHNKRVCAPSSRILAS